MQLIIIISLLLTQILLSSIVFAIKTEIRHYPNVTLNECGIGRESQLMDDTCFEWHNSQQLSQSSIRDGRDVTDGEMPFTVFLVVIVDQDPHHGCSGVILNTDWVITAAHCVKPLNETTMVEDVWVFPGLRHFSAYNVSEFIYVKQYYPHPEFNWTNIGAENDIALLQLNTSIVLETKGPYTNINSVCLPQKGISYPNYEPEFALISGWGYLDEHSFNFGSLQMGWTVISSNSKNKTILVEYKHGSHKPVICRGDSGGPLIQYVGGRAVLIGVAHGMERIVGSSTPLVDCPDKNTKHLSYMRVSPKIDWIISVIENPPVFANIWDVWQNYTFE